MLIENQRLCLLGMKWSPSIENKLPFVQILCTGRQILMVEKEDKREFDESDKIIEIFAKISSQFLKWTRKPNDLESNIYENALNSARKIIEYQNDKNRLERKKMKRNQKQGNSKTIKIANVSSARGQRGGKRGKRGRK